MAQESCIGDKKEVRFFLKSISGEWYWGNLQEENVSNSMKVLPIAYGASAIPVKLIAIYLGPNEATANSDSAESAIFVQSINEMTMISNSILAGGVNVKAALAPIAIMQEINAEKAE